MAMRCFGRARLAGAGARPLDLSFLRAVGLAAVLPAALLRAGDFFCWALRLAARDVGFFFLAIDVLPFLSRGKTLAQIALRRVGKAACPPQLEERRRKRAHHPSSKRINASGTRRPPPAIRRA